jgi:hypothetical protein
MGAACAVQAQSHGLLAVLFLLFGSSGAGKTFVLDVLRDRVPDLAIHEFDEIGIPPDAGTAWRHRANEEWVRRALAYQAEETDLLLAGQTPFGELLATPSAPRRLACSTATTMSGSPGFRRADQSGCREAQVSSRTT